MNQELKISFLDKIKRPDTGNKFVNILLIILIIPFYPIFWVLGLLLMGFIGLIALWQRMTTSKLDLRKQREETLDIEKDNEQWRSFVSTNEIVIEQQLAGSLLWDSGDYLYLRSIPAMPYLANKLFGDWLLVDFGGLFLQKWNHVKNINCDLIFIDLDTLKVTELKKGLQSKHWTAEKNNSDEIKFTFSTGDDDLIYIVRRTDINKTVNS